MLDNELKNSPFETPEGYFDTLPSRIQDRCIGTKKASKISFVPKFALAGAFALFLALFFSDLGNNSKVEKPQNQQIETVASQENSFTSEEVFDYLSTMNVRVNDILIARN